VSTIQFVPAILDVLPQLVANDGILALQAAIADPERFAVEPKVDGVRGLVVFDSDGRLETRNPRGIRRDWLRGMRSSSSGSALTLDGCERRSDAGASADVLEGSL
jgi:hypothetical protein